MRGTTPENIKDRHPWARSAACALVTIATVFWAWFGISPHYAEVIGPMGRLTRLLAPGGLFAVSGLVAWRWEGVGGALFIIEGVVTLSLILRSVLLRRLTPSTVLLLVLTLAVPLLAAGILYSLCSQRTRPTSRSPYASGEQREESASRHNSTTCFSRRVESIESSFSGGR